MIARLLATLSRRGSDEVLVEHQPAVTRIRTASSPNAVVHASLEIGVVPGRSFW